MCASIIINIIQGRCEMAQVHEKFIKNYLYKKPAILSTQLISAVKKEFPNCNETNIRKIISNTAKKGLINSSAL